MTVTAKRAFDVACVIAACPLWMPLAAVVALFVLACEGRPVLFRQRRAGLRGEPFELLKFRTMRAGPGADAERLTRLGRFLRATSLDELPQLLNVLGGTMSLVGPRPLPVAYLPRYTAEQRRRHDVPPGLTGLAQIHGRNALTWEAKFAWDLEYARTHSFWGDVVILLKTVAVVLSSRGVAAEGAATMPEFKGSEDA